MSPARKRLVSQCLLAFLLLCAWPFTLAAQDWRSPTAVLESNYDRSSNIRVSLKPDKSHFRPGDEITFTAETDRDCYLTVMSVGRSGRVVVLWPDRELRGENRVRANTRITIPRAGAGFQIRADGRSPYETIIAYATTEKHGILQETDFRDLPDAKVMVFVGDAASLKDAFRRRVDQLPRHVVWGTAELLIQVASSEPGSGRARSSGAPSAVSKVVIYKDDPRYRELARDLRPDYVIDYPDRQVFAVRKQELERLPLSSPEALPVNEDINKIYLRDRVIDTSKPIPSVPRELEMIETSGGQLQIVQFAGFIKEEWLETLEERASGAEKIVSYLPNNAYLVWTDGSGKKRLEEMTVERKSIQWTGPFHPAYKISPELMTGRPDEDEDFQREVPGNLEPEGLPTEDSRSRLIPKGGLLKKVTVRLVDHPAAEETIRFLESKAHEVIAEPFTLGSCRYVTVRVAQSDIPAIATRQDVVYVEPYSVPRALGEHQAQIAAGNLDTSGSRPLGPGYMRWLSDARVGQEADFVVDITDSGVDRGSTDPRKLHPGFCTLSGMSRVVYVQGLKGNKLVKNSYNCRDENGHGTHVAGIIAGLNDRNGPGFQDADGFRYGLGIAPFVKIGSTRVLGRDGSGRFGAGHLRVTIRNAYAQGARISNNSWGGGTGAYDVTSALYDSMIRNVFWGTSLWKCGNPTAEFVVVFAAGNAGPAYGSIGSGGPVAKNTLVVGNSKSWINPQAWSDSDDVRDVHRSSSRGPAKDGRFKPDMMAPGTNIVSTASQSPNLVPQDYFPPGQKYFAKKTGTSMAAPAVTGAAALLRQKFIVEYGRAPSPAMTKAYLMNATQYLTGRFANDDLPSNVQGMGRLNLRRTFDNTPRMLLDQEKPFNKTGQVFHISGEIHDRGKPFRVTLVWTDHPGTPEAGIALTNDLDLEVKLNGRLYKGNVFKRDVSQEGGKPDSRNNVESVWLPAGATGNFTITIRAKNIATNAVHQSCPGTLQDFALVVYNGREAGGRRWDQQSRADGEGSLGQTRYQMIR